MAITNRLIDAPVRDADWLFGGRDRDLLAGVVRGLQQRVGLGEAIAPLLEFRRQAAFEHPERAAETAELCDALLLRALSVRYDAMDRAVREMTMAYAEVDRSGIVVYANRAFLAIAPESLNRPFAGLFNARADEVQAALAADRATSLLLEMPIGRKRFSQLRVIIGPLADEAEVAGAFALMIDMGGDDRLYDAAPDGILRINALSRITYANRRACELLGVKPDRLISCSVNTIFHSGSI